MKRLVGEISFVGLVVLLLLVLAFILSLPFLADWWKCSSRWSTSGVQSSYGPIQGCLVEVKPGRWVPDDRVREVDLE